MGALRERPPLDISIVPDGKGAVGKTNFPDDCPPEFKNYLGTSREKQNYTETRILIEVAGTIAHDTHAPSRAHDAGDAHDLQWARMIIDQNASWAQDDREAYLQGLCDLARTMIEANWAWVQAVARALVEQRELTGADVTTCRPT